MKEITVKNTNIVLEEEDKKRLLKWLIDKNMSQAALARSLNISKTYLNLVLNGKRQVSYKIIKSLEELGYNVVLYYGEKTLYWL